MRFPNFDQTKDLVESILTRENVHNAAIGGAAGIAGIPVDLVSVLLRAGGYDVPPEQTVGSTEWIGEKLGADIDTKSFFAGAIGTPTPNDALPAIFAGLRAMENLKSSSDAVRTSHGMRTGHELEDALIEASRIADKGGDPWKEHGWFKGVDNKWRFEIDDSGASFGNGLREKGGYKYGGIGNDDSFNEVINHPDAFSAHPDLNQIKPSVIVSPAADEAAIKGSFRPDEALLEVVRRNEEDALSTTLHETMHGVQELENFARGSSVDAERASLWKKQTFLDNLNGELSHIAQRMDEARAQGDASLLAELKDDYQWTLDQRSKLGSLDANDLYRRSAGETEARLVQKRQNMSPMGRKFSHPTSMMDVLPEQQIVRFK